MRAAKVDSNHAEITNHLRSRGWSVQSLAKIGDGCADVVVGAMKENILLEYKVKGGKLNALQRKWHANWQGDVFTVYSPEEAEAVVLAVLFHKGKIKSTLETTLAAVFGE